MRTVAPPAPATDDLHVPRIVLRDGSTASVRQARPEDAACLLECLLAAFEPYRGLYTPAAFADTVLSPGTFT